ncbi:MAG: Asp-tRNA(Asn)/Glu-tRNA(Gln) amidotransferase subunit GatB, partial [Flavobacteriales bacterium]
MQEKYEAVIGLEVHAQLLTQTKAYSNDENIYGAIPNTKTSPVTLGHPGTLPVSNTKVIEYAVKLGLSVGAKIRRHNEYARKNYFYADLPKGYQITQDTTPICNGGVIEILDDKNEIKKINITRIHMEEDAGKSIHDLDP